MLSYALSNNFVHNLNINISNHTSFQNKTVLTILPITVDTKNNRDSMPDVDKTKWLPP